MSTFGELLKADRERLNLTQEALGKLLGVSQQTVAQWEQDKAQPRRERRQHLLQILGQRSALRSAIEHPPHVPEAVLQLAPGQSTQDARDLAELLPRELRLHLDGEHGIGDNRSRYDYLSPNLVAMTKRIGDARFGVWHQIAPEVLRLAVARQIDRATGRSRECILFVVRERPVAFRTAKRLAFEAGVLGVSIVPVRTLEQVARAVQRIETEGPIQPDADRPDGMRDLMGDFEDDAEL